MTIVFNRCTPTSYNFIAVALQAIKLVHDKGGRRKKKTKLEKLHYTIFVARSKPFAIYECIYAHFVSILHRPFYSRLQNSTQLFLTFNSLFYFIFISLRCAPPSNFLVHTTSKNGKIIIINQLMNTPKIILKAYTNRMWSTQTHTMW